MRSFLLSLFLFFGSYTFSQGFTIQNNFISISGNSTDSDFYDNTYLQMSLIIYIDQKNARVLSTEVINVKNVIHL